MGSNNLYKVENTLRSIAKRYKSVKYSLGLAILFLMLGVSAFSEDVVSQEAVAQKEIMSNEQIAESKENLKNSVGSLQSKIDTARKENEKGLTGLKLELIQLMEQGDQVVKSPWASWQFGANYNTMTGEVHIKEEEINLKNIHLKEYIQEVIMLMKDIHHLQVNNIPHLQQVRIKHQQVVIIEMV